jgi:hypothetical protein
MGVNLRLQQGYFGVFLLPVLLFHFDKKTPYASGHFIYRLPDLPDFIPLLFNFRVVGKIVLQGNFVNFADKRVNWPGKIG